MASLFYKWRPETRLRLSLLLVLQVLVVNLLASIPSPTRAAGIHNTDGNVPQFTNFTFMQEPVSVTVFKTEAVRLDCQTSKSRNRNPSIQWIHNGNYIEGSMRRYQLNNGSLYISEVDKSADSGLYQCAVTEEGLGTLLSRKATLEVAYLKKSFSLEPRDLSIYLQDTAMFQCDIEGIPRPNITWFKDGTLVVDRTSKFRTYPEGVLEIADVAFSDFGNYYCEADGAEKSRKSAAAKLEHNPNIEQVHDGLEPKFVLRPRDTSALVGSKVILFCGANGRDEERRQPVITWLKDGVTIDFSHGRLAVIGGGNLQILNLNEKDDGTYTCRAENSIDSADADAKLTVLAPPTFTVRPQNTFAHEKTDIRLDCEVKGNPRPNVTWLKNGDPLNDQHYIQLEGTSLRILGLVMSDYGLYQCFAENSLGTTQAASHLIVLKQGTFTGSFDKIPSEPRDLVAAITSTRYITLSWTIPEHPVPSEIISYSVLWNEIGSERERVMNTTTKEANINRLKPNTEYEFKVRAYNRFGPSNKYAYLRHRTEQEVDVPSEARNLQARALSPTSVGITWEPPLDPKGAITQYDLIYYAVGDSDEQRVTVARSAVSHILMGLKKYREYSFRVVAHNINGPGMSTEEIVARTYSDRPSAAPQNFTLETSSSSSIVVRWEPPPDDECNGQITGYKVRFKKQGASGETVTTDGNRRLYALTDLQKDMEYMVRISAQTVNGSGPATDWLKKTTYKDDLDETRPPDLPERLVVRARTTSLIVQWVPNRGSKILVRDYVLGYGKGIPDVFRQVFQADTFYHEIENLQPASEYVVSIRASNNKGEGQPRYETVFTLESTEEEPATPMLPPIGLKTVVLSASAIIVTWTDDSLGKNQRITDNRYYTVKYAASRSRPKYHNSTDLVAHINDLKPATTYEFAVKIVKGRRESTWSMSVSNTTLEAAPGSMPRDLTPVPVEGDPLSVTLNWQPPQKPNGLITGYLVFYTIDSSLDDRNWVVEGVLGDKLSKTIRDLTQDTTYYFKVQARNKMGYGPISSTVYYKTPKAGRSNFPNKNFPDPDTSPGSTQNTKDASSGKKDNQPGGITQNVMIIIIACVVGVTFCIVVAVVTIVLCRKRDAEERNKRAAAGPKSPIKGKGQKACGPPRDAKPPDLWIDHDPLELQTMGKVGHAESTTSMASTRRNSHDTKSIDTLPPGMDILEHKRKDSIVGDIMYHSGSDIDDRLPPPHLHTSQSPPQQQPQQQRSIIRPKPIMIPVDTQMPPREAVATVTAFPNGHLMQRLASSQMPTTSCVEDSGVIPMRPVYPRTQYQMPYVTGPPRVNAGDISQPSNRLPILEEDAASLNDSHEEPYHSRVGYDLRQQEIPHNPMFTPEKVGFRDREAQSPPYSPEKAQVTGIASPLMSPDACNSLTRRNPLRSFSVPTPPSSRCPDTPKHIVKPQQSASPYKKPTPPISSGPIKPRTPMSIITHKAPDVTLDPGKEVPDIQKSLSTEELTAEMANLEGLMKDLNAITQQNFEC
ncbi:hypothetical protein CHS0354_034065 [Potamilus streckersoni]|uniref:Neogenin n=1 Tax=Potamilus streckersoni TaxID=2493646 RepID=A0AAE0VKK2_9BIVA|nr:hypothetical protein CHS0354_034065 [Potamilus streckersoni]